MPFLNSNTTQKGDRNSAPTEAAFLDQMMKNTSEDCRTNDGATPLYKFGPYLTKMPANPISGLSQIKIVQGDDDLPAPDDTTYGVSVESKGSNKVVYTITNTAGVVKRTCAPVNTGGCAATADGDGNLW